MQENKPNLKVASKRKKPRTGSTSLLATFGRFAPNRVFASIILGMISGALYSLAIPLILTATRGPLNDVTYVEPFVEKVWFFEVSNISMATFFMCFCLLILITRAAASIMLTRVSMNLTSSLRARLCDRVARAP